MILANRYDQIVVGERMEAMIPTKNLGVPVAQIACLTYKNLLCQSKQKMMVIWTSEKTVQQCN